ncbi:hypothetical protein TRIUR3_29088 [Triticum urartu]|uniref:Uncharacterized protein n=2 Tax=Triticinae TaxID=1648030 RepID=M8A7D3_TRIUA|nr:hypothetical protein TRIUR3_29088 [Triticum urartu]
MAVLRALTRALEDLAHALVAVVRALADLASRMTHASARALPNAISRAIGA